MSGSPSPYAPGIIADDRHPPRPAGRPAVFLVATFVSSLVCYPGMLFERAEQSETAGGAPNRATYLYIAASAPRMLMLLWAFLSDRLPLWGTRREGYVLFTALLAPIALALTAISGERQLVWIVAAVLFGAALAISRAATSGALAEIGQRRATTGRLAAAYLGAMQLGEFATFGSSMVSEMASPWISLGGAIGLSLAVVLVIIVLPDDSAAASAPAPGPNPSIPRFLGSRAFWSSFLVCALAGAATVPKELVVGSPPTTEGGIINPGWLAPWMVVVSFIGAAAIYFVVCRRIRFGVLLRATLVVKAGALVACALVSSPDAAPIAFLARATANGLLSVALLEMALRVAPPGREAFAVALLGGVTTVMITAKDWIGSALALEPTGARGAGFAAAAALAAAIAATLLPRRFVETPDGRVLGSAP